MDTELVSEDEEEQIENIKDELYQPITDPIKESTVDYYLKKKDQVVLKTTTFYLKTFKSKVFFNVVAVIIPV